LRGVRSVRDYAVVTAAYWAFTLTDGALRMLVLLYLNGLGYAPLEIASLFLFYEFFGIVTNYVGGWLGARFGLKSTLFAGLALQVGSLALLGWRAAALSVPLVMFAQALSGVAKDLTKMSAKSYIKLVVPRGDAAGLMKWVALLTGSKNTLKGAGFFLGGALLAAAGFRAACFGMAGGVAAALLGAALLLPRAPGKAETRHGLGAVVSRDPRINWLCVARMFLFGARDIWFVLAVPIFLASTLRWSFSEVGGFLALWVIGYGVVQAAAPRFFRRPGAGTLAAITAALLAPLGALAAALALDAPPQPALVAGLALFGVVFAANSAVHSYLIVHYAEEDRVALAVGFYYMANAIGRLLGTLLSGALFQWGGQGTPGLLACLLGSIAFVVFSALACGPLRRAEQAATAATR
jgi:predicted MFS family arabinose efflux permease